MTEPTGQSEIDVGAIVAGTYQVTGLIGRGGMGAVWVAQHMRLAGKRVAVKVLLSSSTGDEAYQRFRREADIASRLGHPNIIEVIDFNHTPSGTPYLILEYLTGENLGSRIAKGPVPLDTTLNVARQIGSALAAAHRAGVVHRDLKPDNIFLCPTDMGGVVGDMVKVLDFGISKIRSSTTLQTQEARILGTPQYMSPEQASGKNSSIDERTDVFALGAIIYEMLCGRPAFSGDNLAMVVYQVVFAEPTPVDQLIGGLPPNVIQAIQRAMAKDAANRYPDVASFIAELTGRPLHTIDRLSAQSAAPLPAAASIAFAPTGAHPGLAATAAASASLPPPSYAQPTPGLLPAGTMPGQPATGTVPGQPVPVPVPPPAKKSSKAWLWVVFGLMVVGGGGGGAFLALRGRGGGGETPTPPQGGGGTPTAPTTPDPPFKPPVVVIPAMGPDAAPAASPGTPDAAPPATPDAAPPATPDAAPPATPDAAVVVASKKPDPKPDPKRPDPDPKPDPKRPDPDPKHPDGEEEDPRADEPAPLKDARAALASGDYRTAVRAAQRALVDLPAGRKGPAYATMTMGYCGQKDLSNAKASFQNVPRRGQGNVARFCSRHGVELR